VAETNEHRTRPALTIAGIQAAALRIVRTDGLDGLSLRRLAGDLDVWPTALYHHVGDKSGLIQLVLDGVLDQLEIPSDDLEWQEWMRTFATRGRALLLAFPGVAAHLEVVGNPSRASFAVTETAVAKLLDAGFDAEQAAVLWVDLFAFVLARVRREELVGSGDPADLEHYRQAHATFALMVDETMPAVAAASAHWFSLAQRVYLERGIDLLLAGAATWLDDTDAAC
jgi:AcrR family transcriptional regulator